MSATIRCLAVSALAVCVGCSSDAPVEREKPPRPVSVLILKQMDPQRSIQLTGSVSSWKTELIGFQVGGRVESVLEPGADILGRTVDENGDVITQGTVIAELETDRYELALASAKAQKETAIARAKARQSELENVLPQQIKAAQASVTLTQQEFDRASQLFKREALSAAQLDQAKANLDTAQAELAQTKATEKVTQAELDSLNAQAKEAEENVRQAQKDLDDTKLVSPYHGQIAEVHEIPGGYVQAGERVVTVQMMDPMQVDVAVSAQTDARLNYNDVIDVYLPDSKTPSTAMVYEKDTMADAATRTFSVKLLVRNEQIEVGLPPDEQGKDTPRVRTIFRVTTQKADGNPPYFVAVKALYQDADGYFVWKIENRTLKDNKTRNDSGIRLRKIRVTPGDKRMPFLQVVTLRELADLGDLDPAKDVVAGVICAPDGRRLTNDEIVGIQDGDTVLYVRERWRLRPGDIVRVDLEGSTVEVGLYVPTDTILEKSGKTYVFAVESLGEADQVRQIEVDVFDDVGTLRRIEAAGDATLEAGMKIVANGALFLTDGEKVTVVDEMEVH